MELLRLSGITKQLNGKIVLNDISFSQQSFQKIAIAGETGAGKTSLLKIIAGLVQPGGGAVLFENKKLLGPDEKLIPGHEAIAYISQALELRNNYRIEEELDYTNRLTAEEAATIFDICCITHLLKNRTDEVSGGERQRIIIARALIASPKLLLLDEPFSNLDTAHKQLMKSVIDEITTKLKTTCILVSHDPLDVLSWSESIIVIKNGMVVQQGNPQHVYLQPLNEYVAGLFGKYNLINTEHKQFLPWLKNKGSHGKNLFIRPEKLFISTAGDNAIKGTINKITFFGSYSEIEIMIGDLHVTLVSSEPGFSLNESVYISIDNSAEHYI